MVHLKKPVLLIAFIILFSLFAGCIYVNPLEQAGENASDSQATAIQVCQISCENHIRYLPLGCICPETPAPVPATATPTPTGT